MENMSNGRGPAMSTASRVLAIIGFLALVVIGMWGSVRVAQAVPGTLSNIAAAFVSITQIFVPASETLTLSMQSASVLVDTPVTIAFEHKNRRVEGTYSFRYSCVDGVSFDIGGTAAVACNTPFSFTPFNNSITVTPASTANRFVDVEVFIAFTPDNAGTPTIIGSKLITIENQKVSGSPTTVTPPTTTPTTPVTPKPKPPVTPRPGTTVTIPVQTGPVNDPNGYTDLVARVIEIGIVDKTTGSFIATSSPHRSDRVAVRYAIENIGTKMSREFAFSVVLPTYPPYTYFSQMQPALAPGDRIEYTIGFDSFVEALTGDVVINVDPTGSVNERNKDNNIVHYTMTVIK